MLRRGRLPLIPRHHATVEDPDDPDIVLRLVPETGNTSTGGGAYLLLEPVPAAAATRAPRAIALMHHAIGLVRLRRSRPSLPCRLPASE